MRRVGWRWSTCGRALLPLAISQTGRLRSTLTPPGGNSATRSNISDWTAEVVPPGNKRRKCEGGRWGGGRGVGPLSL